ncbi:MAG: EmrB/QacA subfamily drug resistance transporter [Pseudohongiellaceae bacterium]|jgi:EmrB/QacA subfamily drug resistance transporter
MSQIESYTSLQKSVLVMVLLNALSVPIMLSSVNVALPHIAADLALSALTTSWIPTAFLMASAMFILVFGRLADMFGRKRVFLMGSVFVVFASLLAAASTGAISLLSARFLQGVGAAMLYATQMAIVSSVFPVATRGRVIGLVISFIYIGLATGPLLGGIVVDQFGWRINFLLQIPLAVLVFFIGVYKVEGEWAADERGSFDFTGALIYCLAILIVCIGVSFLPSLTSYILIAAGLIGIGIFFQQAKSSEHPLMDVNLFFTNKTFTFSCLASFIMYTATFMNVVLLSLYLQYLKGLSPTTAGLLMMVQPLTMAIFSPLMGKLSDNTEPRILASAGMSITALGLMLLAMLNSESQTTSIVLALVVTGLGFSLFSSPNVNAIMSSVSRKYLGAAAAAVSTTRILGQLSSMVLVTLVMALNFGAAQIEPSSYSELEKTISFSFYLAAAICLPGLVLSAVRGTIHSTE